MTDKTSTSESTFVKAGRKGGKKLLRTRGRKHFAKIAAMRKTFGGGRPKGSGTKAKTGK